MSVTELFTDRTQTIESSGKYVSLELFYLARDIVLKSDLVVINGIAHPATTEYYALEAVRATAPKAIYGMARNELRIVEKIDDGSYKIAVKYDFSGSQSPGQEDDDFDIGDRTIAFSGSGGTRHITHSFETLQKIGVAPDEGGAINVDKDQTINGVDVLAPALSFTETHYMTYKKFNIRYIRDINALQGKVNDKQFRGFAAGEVRFDTFAASRHGSKREDLYEITFYFSVIPNQPAMEIHGLAIPAKEGWDYIWYRTRKEEARTESAPEGSSDGQGSAGDVVNDITGAYIERIYQRGDFGKLRIKTGPFVPIGDE